MNVALGLRSTYLAHFPQLYKLLPAPKRFFKRRNYVAAAAAAPLQIGLVPCLKDNYAYLLHDSETGVTGIIDPSESRTIVKALTSRNLHLDYILNTHHHWDHTGGNIDLKDKYKAKVIGSATDQARIPGIDITLEGGDSWMFGNQRMIVFDTPGHTRGHLCFYFPGSSVVFTGDTLFSLSCGKLFEGTPQQMYSSLSKLMALPDHTLIYCGHEYSLSNAEFALTLEPNNNDLRIYYDKIRKLRQDGHPTIPTTVKREKECNPFVRLSRTEIKASLGVPSDADEVQTLAAIRASKDKW